MSSKNGIRKRNRPVYKNVCDGILAKTWRQKRYDFISRLAVKYLAAYPEFKSSNVSPEFLKRPVSVETFLDSSFPLLVTTQKKSVFTKRFVRRLRQSEVVIVEQLFATRTKALIEKDPLPFLGSKSLEILVFWMFHNGLVNPHRYIKTQQTVEMCSIKTGKIRKIAVEKIDPTRR